MYPGRSFFHGHESEPPRTDIALHRFPGEDLYLVLANYDAGQQSAQLAIHINPLVNWIWLGVGVMLIGTFVALLPERAFSFATSRVPEGAVTTSVVLLLLLLPSGMARLHAQHVQSASTVAVKPKSALERDLQNSIVCLCGCGRQRVGECTCDKSAEMREQIAALVAQGKTRDEVIEYFVRQPGAARGADRQGVQPDGLAPAVWHWRGRRAPARLRRHPVVAPRASAARSSAACQR
jgi:cytochrome c-type biogenesis protein CcmF